MKGKSVDERALELACLKMAKHCHKPDQDCVVGCDELCGKQAICTPGGCRQAYKNYFRKRARAYFRKAAREGR